VSTTATATATVTAAAATDATTTTTTTNDDNTDPPAPAAFAAAPAEPAKPAKPAKFKAPCMVMHKLGGKMKKGELSAVRDEEGRWMYLLHVQTLTQDPDGTWVNEAVIKTTIR
jgi:hypothetical protein